MNSTITEHVTTWTTWSANESTEGCKILQLQSSCVMKGDEVRRIILYRVPLEQLRKEMNTINYAVQSDIKARLQ